MSIKTTAELMSDRLVYTNLTKETAMKNERVYDAFKVANTDGDDRISEEEYEEYLQKTSSMDVKTVEVICTRAANPRRYQRTLLENCQVDFYPGLELGNIPNGARDMYRIIDLDKNNELSEDEIQEFHKAKQLFEQTIEQIREKCNKHGKKLAVPTLIGIGATLGAVLAISGPVGWIVGGVIAAGTIGHACYESYSYKKECQEIVDNLLEQTNNHPYVIANLQREISFYFD